MTEKPSPKIALVLTGGGARAAYQVGVLKGISALLTHPRQSPFSIICGTSAGAVNACTVAAHIEQFSLATRRLEHLWGNLHCENVFRADSLGIATSGARWLGVLVAGWVTRDNPKSLLDNAPLRSLLSNVIDFSKIQNHIAHKALHALCISCSGYTSGHNVSFFQGDPSIQAWQRSQRFGSRTEISLDHLMASSALPFIFPAVHINREWFGDGTMRQVAPISPAIHLGAERVLIIGSGNFELEERHRPSLAYPSLAQIAGHAMSSIFLDGVSVDIERMTLINRILSAIPEKSHSKPNINLRKIDILPIMPSRRIENIADQHVKELPLAVRTYLRGVGVSHRNGSALLSYLLFEKGYTHELIRLGVEDVRNNCDAIRHFLSAK